MSSFDIQKIAIEEEYKIFSTNKVVTMYRRGMAFLMADIKDKTEKLGISHSVLTSFENTEGTSNDTPPTKTNTTGFSGFQTALQVSKNMMALPKKDEIENKCKI